MNASIIKLNYEEQEKRSFSKKLINKFTLKNNSYSPYLVLLKVFFAIFLALLFDTYITKNPDSVSSAFTAILCISTTVTRGIKACVSTFLMCCIGAIVSSLGNIIFGVDTTFLWRVPFGTAVTYYIMFLCNMEDDVGGLSAGAFSAIFVQLTLFEYNPLVEYTDKKWLHTFVVRLLSVFTGCVSSFIINSVFDIVYYKLFFKAKLKHFSNSITMCLHDFINEPENYFLELKYQLLNDIIVDINYAINEINFSIFKGNSFIHYTNSEADLKNYKNLVYSYLRLLNHLSFLGYQKETLSEEEIKTVKRVVKQCIMKLYSNQFHIKETSILQKIGYFESEECINIGKNSNNNIDNDKEINDTSSSSRLNQFIINEDTNDKECNNNIIVNIGENNTHVFNNEYNEENIQETLKIPLTSIIRITNKIIISLDKCKLL